MLPLMTLPPRDPDSTDSEPLDLVDKVMSLDNEALASTLSGLQDLVRQMEGIRARLDTKATTLLSAAGVSLTISPRAMCI